jgi:CheY-like chemotaxis protein
MSPEAPATILVVDDDLFTAELTGMTLEAAGHDVVIAEGALDALEKLASDPAIWVIVSDLNMPFMDGLQLLEELREQGFSQPFVLLSGQETPLRPGIAAVLIKDENLQEALPQLIAELQPGGRPSASSAKEPTPEAGPSGAPDHIAGMDLQASLRGMGGNWGVLRSLLLELREDYQGAVAEYRLLLQQGETHDCLAHLHTLKGVVGMLGGERLHGAIDALETALKTGAPHQEPWAAFEVAMDELLRGIGEI